MEACGEKDAAAPPPAPEFSVFVGDLAPDVNDFLLQESFR